MGVIQNFLTFVDNDRNRFKSLPRSTGDHKRSEIVSGSAS
jgi:hypothetical protein